MPKRLGTSALVNVSLLVTGNICPLLRFQFSFGLEVLPSEIRGGKSMRKKETKLSFFTGDTAEIQAANEILLVIRNRPRDGSQVSCFAGRFFST